MDKKQVFITYFDFIPCLTLHQGQIVRGFAGYNGLKGTIKQVVLSSLLSYIVCLFCACYPLPDLVCNLSNSLLLLTLLVQ